MKATSDSQTVGMQIERVSVLLDGELDSSEADVAISAVCADASLRRAWHELHLAGDALRSHEVAAWNTEGFAARVAAAIANEPTVLAPRAKPTRSARRYWISGMAVAASVAAVGFIALPLLRAPEPMTVAKSAPISEVADEAAAQKSLPTIANARGLNRPITPYLAAHRELTGGTVVPSAAVYLRTNEER